MKTRKHLPRRSVIGAIATRAAKLSDSEAAAAWRELAGHLDDLAITPMPKYQHVIDAIRKATITAKLRPAQPEPLPLLEPATAHSPDTRSADTATAPAKPYASAARCPVCGSTWRDGFCINTRCVYAPPGL